jgi:hypothetical protein
MVPQKKLNPVEERTVELPAQEKVAFGDQPTQTLSAEQVYAQRLAEKQQNSVIHMQDYIP